MRRKRLISADIEQQRVTEPQWKHNGDSPPPNASHLPSLALSSHRCPCQTTAQARLVQQSCNKTTLINASLGGWGGGGGGQQIAYTFKFYTELVRANSPSSVQGKTPTPTNPRRLFPLQRPRPAPNLFIHCRQLGASRWSKAPAASWFTARDRQAFG